MDGRAPGSIVREIDDMQDKTIALTVKMKVDESRTLYCQGNVILESPTNQIPEKLCVIRKVVITKLPVDIGRQECNPAALGSSVDDQSGNIRFRRTHPRSFRRINWKIRNESHEYF